MSKHPFGDIVELGAFLKQDLAKLTGEEVKKLHVTVAKSLKAEAMAGARITPKVTTIVDGTKDAREEQVKPFGVIAYRFQYWAETAEAALSIAREMSPRASGLYRDSWFIIANNAVVTPEQIPADVQEIILVNDQPYHRKIEVGTITVNLGGHVAERTRQIIQQRFGNSIRAEVKFIGLNESGSGRASPVPWISGTSDTASTSQKRRAVMTYPAVIMRPL